MVFQKGSDVSLSSGREIHLKNNQTVVIIKIAWSKTEITLGSCGKWLAETVGSGSKIY